MHMLMTNFWTYYDYQISSKFFKGFIPQFLNVEARITGSFKSYEKKWQSEQRKLVLEQTYNYYYMMVTSQFYFISKEYTERLNLIKKYFSLIYLQRV